MEPSIFAKTGGEGGIESWLEGGETGAGDADGNFDAGPDDGGPGYVVWSRLAMVQVRAVAAP